MYAVGKYILCAYCMFHIISFRIYKSQKITRRVLPKYNKGPQNVDIPFWMCPRVIYIRHTVER